MARLPRRKEIKRMTVELPLSVFEKMLALMEDMEASSMTEVVIRTIRYMYEGTIGDEPCQIAMTETATVEIDRGEATEEEVDG